MRFAARQAAQRSNRRGVRLPFLALDFCFFGDRAAYTGKVVEAYGGTFYEVKMLEGHMEGQLKAVKQPPMPKGEVTS